MTVLPPASSTTITRFDSCHAFPGPCSSSLFLYKKKGVEEKEKMTWCLSIIYPWISPGNKKQNNKGRIKKEQKGTWWSWRRHWLWGETVSNQYRESAGIWNGAQGQFSSSTSAADCASHPRGEASQGCSTTALDKSIVLHLCVCVCVSVQSAHKLNVRWQRGPGEVCWVRKLCKQGDCYGSRGQINAAVKVRCFAGWDLFCLLSFLLLGSCTDLSKSFMT